MLTRPVHDVAYHSETYKRNDWRGWSGYECVPGWHKYGCSRSFNVGTSTCAGCQPDRYGPNCDQCNCGFGSCNSGLAGNGQCKCDTGYTGTNCVNNQHRANCMCADCTTGYVKGGSGQCFGPCPGTNCGPGGTCGYSAGSTNDVVCSCNTGWTKDVTGACTVCQANHHGSSCDACTCNSHSDCDDGNLGSGACVCHASAAQGYWKKPTSTSQCTHCLDGHYGSDCKSTCPGVGAGGGAGTQACSGHGTCSDGTTGNGVCTCATGYSGIGCDGCAPTHAVCSQKASFCIENKCSSKVCLNGGTCELSSNANCDAASVTATCRCPADYTGADCGTKIDECLRLGNPCQNNGKCVDGPGGLNDYTCICSAGFTGRTCTEYDGDDKITLTSVIRAFASSPGKVAGRTTWAPTAECLANPSGLSASTCPWAVMDFEPDDCSTETYGSRDLVQATLSSATWGQGYPVLNSAAPKCSVGAGGVVATPTNCGCIHSKQGLVQWFSDLNADNINVVSGGVISLAPVSGSTDGSFSFAPGPNANGCSYFPANQAGVGGETYLFTTESRSYFEYNPNLDGTTDPKGPQYVEIANAANDVWVFVNSHLLIDLGGLRNSAGGAPERVQLKDRAAAFGLVAGETYEIAIFTAQRKQTGTSCLDLKTNIQLICSARTVGVTSFKQPGTSTGPWSYTGLQANGGAPKSGVNEALLTTAGSQGQKGALWVKARQNIKNGFVARFTYRATNANNVEGFAFVVQNNGLAEVGGNGNGLGYDG
eukprot:g4035.t1